MLEVLHLTHPKQELCTVRDSAGAKNLRVPIFTIPRTFGKEKKKGVLFDTELPNHVETQAKVPTKKAMLKRSVTKHFLERANNESSRKQKKNSVTSQEQREMGLRSILFCR